MSANIHKQVIKKIDIMKISRNKPTPLCGKPVLNDLMLLDRDKQKHTVSEINSF